MNILMIGYNVTLMRALESINDSRYAVVIFEEPDLYEKKHLSKHDFKCLKKVIFTEYQQSTTYLNVINEVASEYALEAVVPGLEVSVRFSTPSGGPPALRE